MPKAQNVRAKTKESAKRKIQRRFKNAVITDAHIVTPGVFRVFWRERRKAQKQNLSPRRGGKGMVHVRAHARRGTKGIRAHTRKR